MEFLRGSLLFDGYPWLLAAHPLIEFSALAMPARLFGTYFVSLLCVTVSVAVHELWRGKQKAGFAVLFGVGVFWVLLGLLGTWNVNDNTDSGLTIGLIQTDVPQSVKGSWPPEERIEEMNELVRMTGEASAQIGARLPSVIVLARDNVSRVVSR